MCAPVLSEEEEEGEEEGEEESFCKHARTIPNTLSRSLLLLFLFLLLLSTLS